MMYGKPRKRVKGPVPPAPRNYGEGAGYSAIRDSEAGLTGSDARFPRASAPANQSSTREGSTRPKTPPQKTYVSKGLINQNAGSAREGQSYAVFTVKGRPGEFHEYVDAKTGKKTVVRVTK